MVSHESALPPVGRGTDGRPEEGHWVRQGSGRGSVRVGDRIRQLGTIESGSVLSPGP